MKLFVEPNSFNNQVLGNIVSNAIKFSLMNSSISILASRSGDKHFIVEIKDCGIGIPKKMLDQIFDINKKTSRKGTNGEEGSGFGMNMIKSFIEMYQGHIEIESSEGSPECSSGTTVKLKLKGQWK